MLHSLALACLLAAQAAAPASPDDLKLDQDVRRWLREMDRAETIGERDAARDALILLGPKILDRLPAPKEADTADFKQRLEQIRVTLEKKQAVDFAQGTPITISGKGLKASAVLADLEKQSGNKLMDYRKDFNETIDDPSIDLELKGVPFWKALDEILDKSGLTRYPHPQDAHVAYQNLPEGTLNNVGRASYGGAFRLEATEVHIQRQLRRVTPGSMQIDVELVWEPKLKPISISHDLKKITVTDDAGATLAIDQEAEPEIPLTPADTSASLIIPAPAPARNAKSITVKGTLDVLLPGKVGQFEFPNLSAKPPIVKRQGAATVTLESIQKNNEVWELKLLVQFDAASGALESHRSWVTDNPCRLMMGEKALDPDGAELYRRDANSIGVAYLFALENADDLKKCKLTYSTPISILKAPIEYELKDVPLP
jgi:hypothetical protein